MTREHVKTKTCTQCKQTKALSQFGTANKAKDGKKSHCKECGKKYRRPRGKVAKVKELNSRLKSDSLILPIEIFLALPIAELKGYGIKRIEVDIERGTFEVWG